MRNISILGSTGSIGRSALEIVSQHTDRFRVVALAAGRNIDILEQQINAFHPQVVAIADEKSALELKHRVSLKTEVLAGDEGVRTVATCKEADFVLSAMVGFIGLIPTMHAIKAGKTIGLANKESLVIAGSIVMRDAERYGSQILPVDSEHSAIFQCINGHDKKFLRKVILTASGGPFIGKKKGELKNIRPDDALRHPNWKMGKKVTIDSATLMNKGLEVIEASHLFGLTAEEIDVLIHPQSIVHSMVEFNDGSMLAQISLPDMKGPIGYALSYPERLDDTVPRLELDAIDRLTFSKPDTDTFPCLKYAYEALASGGTMPAVLNAANEIAVSAFLGKKLSFNKIPVIINEILHSHTIKKDTDLETVIEADRWTREKTEEYIKKCKK